MVPLRTHVPLVFRQGPGVVTSWRAFLAMLNGMVVATVAAVAVVDVDVAADDGAGPFDEQPVRALMATTVNVP
jgi:hypothetical protein